MCSRLIVTNKLFAAAIFFSLFYRWAATAPPYGLGEEQLI
jgi:hypothetical protein